MFKPHRPNPYFRFQEIGMQFLIPKYTNSSSLIILLLSYLVVSLLKKIFFLFFWGGGTNRVKVRPVIGRKSGGVEITDHRASIRRRRSVFEFYTWLQFSPTSLNPSLFVCIYSSVTLHVKLSLFLFLSVTLF